MKRGSAIVLRTQLLAVATVLSGCALSEATLDATASSGTVPSSALLTQDKATDKAIAYLRNTDYGEGRIDVLNHIKSKMLMTSGKTDCGPIVRPVWAFQIQSKFQGWLYIDARTGAKQCSSLPFLR